LHTKCTRIGSTGLAAGPVGSLQCSLDIIWFLGKGEKEGKAQETEKKGMGGEGRKWKQKDER